jgi:hypothetical protein
MSNKGGQNSDHRSLKKRLEGLGSQLKSLEAGYRRRVQTTVSHICEIGREYENDGELWAALCQDEIWAKVKSPPTIDKPEKAMRFAFRLACGLDSAGTKRASFYHLAVAELLEQGVPATDLPGAIQQGGGLKALSKSAKKEKPPDAADKRSGRLRPKPPPLQPKTEAEETGSGETSAGQLALFGAVEQGLPLLADAVGQLELRVSVLNREGNALRVIFHSIKAS